MNMKYRPRNISHYDWIINHRSLWNGECLECSLSPARTEYPRIRVGSKRHKCHRLVWAHHNGPITDGLHVLHKCDNIKCVNIDHLFVGTNQDNVDDKVSKGRQSRGEKHSGVLTEQDVILMLKLYTLGKHTILDLAGFFGVSGPTVHGIVKGKHWRHLIGSVA